MHIPLIFISYPTLLIVCLISDRLEGDEDEPDLPLLSTLDFAALKDVRQTGMEYCRSYERTLLRLPDSSLDIYLRKIPYTFSAG